MGTWRGTKKFNIVTERQSNPAEGLRAAAGNTTP